MNAESAPGEMDALVEGLKRLADAGTESEQLRELLAEIGIDIASLLEEKIQKLKDVLTRLVDAIVSAGTKSEKVERCPVAEGHTSEGYPHLLVRPHPTGRRASRRGTNCDDQYGDTTKGRRAHYHILTAGRQGHVAQRIERGRPDVMQLGGISLRGPASPRPRVRIPPCPLSDHLKLINMHGPRQTAAKRRKMQYFFFFFQGAMKLIAETWKRNMEILKRSGFKNIGTLVTDDDHFARPDGSSPGNREIINRIVNGLKNI